MSTQKNEHNPDKVSPEIVGEGWRLLNDGEPQQAGDEWWNGRRWEPNEEADYGYSYRYVSARRRITPPPDTTGSGREGETPETDRECFPVEVTGPGGAGTDTEYRVDADFARQLERQRDAALAQVEALRRDGELLDHLDSSLNQLALFGNFVMGGEKQSARAAIRRHMEHCKRAAIDSAQRQEKL